MGLHKQSPSVEEIAEDIMSKLLWGRQGLNSYELYLRDVTIKAMIEMRKQAIDTIEQYIDSKIIKYPDGCVEDTYNSTLDEVDNYLQTLKK